MKYLSGIITGVLSFFAPVGPLLVVAMAFVMVDFLTGVLADRHKVRGRGDVWRFESHKAWRTITKLSFVMAGIMLAWMLDGLLLPVVELRLANIFAGFVCGVEFWSYLENASVITGEPAFKQVLVTLRRRVSEALGLEAGDR